jgi:hypothetical protein
MLTIDELIKIQENLAVNNRILEEHHLRSMRLEKIIDVVEKRSYTLTMRLYMLIGCLMVLQPVIFFLLKGG